MKYSTLRAFAVFVLVFVFAQLGVRPALADPGRKFAFTFETIDVPGATVTQALGTNSHEIVGLFADAEGTHGFILRNGVFTRFDVPGALASFIDGINARGDMVGGYVDDQRALHGFFLRDGAVTTLDPPGAVISQAVTVNSHDDVVGTYMDATGTFHGFLWRDAAFTTIDVPNAPATFAGGINNEGQIVGFSIGQTIRGFRLDDGVFSSFEVADDGGLTDAEGINNRGDIVGNVGDNAGGVHGFILSEGVVTRVDVPGALFTQATTFTTSGQVVGFYGDAQGRLHGYVGTRVR